MAEIETSGIPPTQLITTDQAAKMLGVQRNTVQQNIKRGKFPHARKIGRDYFIPPEDLAAFQADKAARAAHKEQRLYNRMSKAAKAEYDARKAQEAKEAAADNNGVIE